MNLKQDILQWCLFDHIHYCRNAKKTNKNCIYENNICSNRPLSCRIESEGQASVVFRFTQKKQEICRLSSVWK